PEEEIPIVAIWISLPELPWHCYHKDILVKVQIDLTKERPPHVWMGLNEEDINIGRWQTIEYEHIPDYYIKELEADRKNKNKGEQGKQDSKNMQMQYTNREDGNNSSQYQQHQKQGNNNKSADEEWQTQ
ncbi:hypothetical protein H5410_046608, partial [Solanum commersonii]